MKNRRGLKYFLGIEVAKSISIFLIIKELYVALALKDWHGRLQTIYTLIVKNNNLKEYANQITTNKEIDQRLVGKEIYLYYRQQNVAYVELSESIHV